LRILNCQLLEDVKGNSDIILQEGLWQLCVSKFVPILHVNLGQTSLTLLKPSNKSNNLYPILIFSLSSLKFREIVCVLFFPFRHLLAHHVSTSHKINLVAMIFKNDPQTTKESVTEPCDIESPKQIDPISTVTSPKSEKKTATKCFSKKRMAPKTKRGESKTPLSMFDLYQKENPFISTVVEPSVGTFKKDPLVGDIEATTRNASLKAEKGNSCKTLISVVPESGRKLGLEDLNEAIDRSENVYAVDFYVNVEIATKDTIQPSPNKSNDLENGEPNVGTSLDQQKK
jgi:hypothetical protein